MSKHSLFSLQGLTNLKSNPNNKMGLAKEQKEAMTPLLWTLNNVVGIVVMLWLSVQWSNYLQTLHENDMWFSNIKVNKSLELITSSFAYIST